MPNFLVKKTAKQLKILPKIVQNGGSPASAGCVQAGGSAGAGDNAAGAAETAGAAGGGWYQS